MPRIVLGNRGGALAPSQARSVLAELTEGWPDVNVSQRTLGSRPGDGDVGLLDALLAGRINIAVQSLETLPLSLPGGVTLAAVTKRLEPRAALVTRGPKDLRELPRGARVGVLGARDRAFLLTARKDLSPELLSDDLDADLALLSAGELDALVMPSATLVQLGRRERIGALLEPQLFTPAPGQGSLALVVRDDDDLAGDLAYSLQHRPSFDRARAERAFAAALSALPSRAVGALATVTPDGELNLLGSCADLSGELVIQAEISGEASEAEELGRELAQDVLEQLKQRT